MCSPSSCAPFGRSALCHYSGDRLLGDLFLGSVVALRFSYLTCFSTRENITAWAPVLNSCDLVTGGIKM